MNKVAKVIPIQDNSENDKEESEDANADNSNEGAVLVTKLNWPVVNHFQAVQIKRKEV